jgi:hypothetical protein
MKAICSFSIDPAVVTLFKSRYPKLASSMVERYMRDALDLDASESMIEDIDAEVEKAKRKIELDKIELRALETKQLNKERQANELVEQNNKTIEEKAKAELEALQSIKDFNWEFEYNYRAKKQNMTAIEFLKTKMEMKA